MPILEMHLMQGRTTDQKRRVVAAITEAVVRELGVNASSVRILITEHGGDDFAVGGVTMAERKALESHQTHQADLANRS
jgi:4-oxalocrotonate tautomerase